MEEVVKFLEENPVFYLATVAGDVPKVRPFGFFMVHNNKLYFGVGDQKQTFRQISENPKVEICTTSKDMKWLRLSGNAVFERSEETLDAAWAKAPNLKDMYTQKDGPRMATFYIEDATAEFLDMEGNYEVLHF